MKIQRGFTIVELLIVIVIIAILATISVIAYAGIQERAKNSELLASFDAAEKAVRLYYAEKGEYPKTMDENGSLIGTPDNPDMPYACLGQPSDYPATDIFAAGQCYIAEGTNYSINTLFLNNQLDSLTPNLHISTSNTFKDSTGQIGLRGISYAGDETGAVLFYMQKGDRACGRGDKTVENVVEGVSETLTTCGIILGDF